MTPNETPRAVSILITDDNRDAVEVLSTFLEVSGFGTVCAYSAPEALETLDAHPGIACVISDVRMPELDGFDFLRVVKHRFPTLKVVLVTGHEITNDDVVPAGATILRKPVDLQRLLEIVSRHD
ncbi:MAG: response regulator [Burkholderiales bacterium]